MVAALVQATLEDVPYCCSYSSLKALFWTPLQNRQQPFCFTTSPYFKFYFSLIILRFNDKNNVKFGSFYENHKLKFNLSSWRIYTEASGPNHSTAAVRPRRTTEWASHRAFLYVLGTKYSLMCWKSNKVPSRPQASFSSDYAITIIHK